MVHKAFPISRYGGYTFALILLRGAKLYSATGFALVLGVNGTNGTGRKRHQVVRYFISVNGTNGTGRKWHQVVRYFISVNGTNCTGRKWHRSYSFSSSNFCISILALTPFSSSEPSPRYREISIGRSV
jgi:hypothetical protein